MKSPRNRPLFQYIAHFSYDHAKGILFTVAGLLAVGVFWLPGIRTEVNPISIHSLKGDVFQQFKDNFRRFGDSHPLVILLESDQVSRETINRFTTELSDELRSQEDISQVVDKFFDPEDASQALVLPKMALHNGPPAINESLLELFTPEGLNKEISRTRKKLITAGDPALRELIAADVLNLRDILYPYFRSQMQHFRISSTSVYFEAQDLSARLIFAYPEGSSSDTRYCMQLLDRVDRAVGVVRDKIPGAGTIQYHLTGKHVLTGESAQVLKGDLLRVNLFSVSLILSLLVLVFRNLKLTLTCFVPIICSLFGALLMVRFFFNPLKFISIGFIAVLLGMGIDISFHLTSRYFQFRSRLRTQKEAVTAALSECGPPVVIGLITTAAAFGVLMLARYSSLVQWGVLTCIGLFIMLFVTFLLFPSVIRLIDPGQPAGKAIRGIGLFPRMLYKPSLSRPFLVVGTAALVVLLSIYGAGKLRFEMEFFELLPKNLRSVKVAQDVSDIFGTSFMLNSQLTLACNDISEGMKWQRRLDSMLSSLVEEEKISGFSSPALFLPYVKPSSGPENPSRRLSERIRNVRSRFFQILHDKGFRDSSQFVGYYERIESMFSQSSEVWEDLPPQAERHVKQEGNRFFLQTLVWPMHDTAGSILQADIPEEVRNFMPADGVDYHLTGTQQILRTVMNMVRTDFLRLSLWALLAVGTILLLFYRNLGQVALSLLPLFGAVPFTLAFIVVSKTSFSPFAIGVIALIIGIGIDNAVHLVARRASTPRQTVESLFDEIAPVLTLTTLSTMIGFGALTLSSYPFFRSLGIIIVIGVFASWVFTMVFLPPLLKSR